MAAQEKHQPAPQMGNRRLATPARSDLLRHYASTESYSRSVIAIELLLTAGCIGGVVIQGASLAGPIPWLGFSLGFLGVFRWFVHRAFLSKKRLEDIRPDARFGVHTRDSLVALSRRIFSSVGLRPGSAPVFIVREKDVNAQAVRCELLPGWHAFNGVFLNRSILHLFDEEELGSVIGHELGHVFPYSPLLSKCYLIHGVFVGVVSLAAAAFFPFVGVAIGVAFALLWMMDWVIAWPHLQLSRAMEFLCDDFGARAVGLLPALSAEVKLGAENEVRRQLLLRALEARQAGGNLNLEEVVEAYQEAVPFGQVDPASFEKEFRRIVQHRQKDRQGLSFRGFLEYLGGGGTSAEADDWMKQQIRQMELIRSVPRLELEPQAYLRGSSRWTLENASRLARALEDHPSHVLFHLPEEVDDRESSHPNTSRRILFLWRNREELLTPGLRG